MQTLSTIRLVSLQLEDQAERRGVSGGCLDALRVLNTRIPVLQALDESCEKYRDIVHHLSTVM